MSGISRDLLGPYPAGVPTPRAVHVHPYPTRYHGSINTRPWFNFPYRKQPHAVFKPDDFSQEAPTVNGLGSLQYQTGRGIFLPQGNGGGIFDENISGVGAALGYSVSNLPWHKYDSDTLALQKDLNKALKDLNQATIKEDGKLGDNTCSAAKYVSKSSGYGYIEVPPECNKSHTSNTTSTPTLVSTTSEATTLPPPRGMSSGTKNVLVFGGAAVLALGGAYLIMKGMKKRKG